MKMYNSRKIKNLSICIAKNEIILDREMVGVDIHLKYEKHDDELAKIDNGVMIIGDFTYSEKVLKFHLKTLFVRAVQEMRKNTNLHPWNKIGIYFKSNNKLLINVLEEYQDDISKKLFYNISFSVNSIFDFN